MSGWHGILDASLSWRVLTPVALAVGALALRPLVDAERRAGIRLAVTLLVLALVIRLLAVALAVAAPIAAGSVDVVGTVFLVWGAFAVVALVVFDVVLVQLRVRVPSIVRELILTAAVLAVVFGVLRGHGLDLFSLVTTSAVVTAVVGLALQNTIANLFAGLALQSDRTLGIGDWIQTPAHVGKIVEIKWRSTSIVTKDGNTVIIPNNELLTSEVLNLSKPTGATRMVLRVGFHYRHPPNDVAAVLLATVRGVPGVLASPAADCFPLEFAESTIVYALRYWITDFERDSPIAGEIQTRIWYAAQRAGLEIPFPIRTIVRSETADDRRAVEHERELTERATALAAVGVFAGLRPEDREFLARGMHRHRFAAGEGIVAQGEAGDSLYVIERGTVGVHVAVDGARGEVARLGPGDCFGEMSLVTGAPRNASCVAETDVICAVLGHDTFRGLLEANPKVADELSALLARRQLALDDERGELSEAARSRSAQERSRLLTHIRAFFRLA